MSRQLGEVVDHLPQLWRQKFDFHLLQRCKGYSVWLDLVLVHLYVTQLKSKFLWSKISWMAKISCKNLELFSPREKCGKINATFVQDCHGSMKHYAYIKNIFMLY